MSDISSRVRQTLMDVQSRPNGYRTRYFVEQARQISEQHPDIRFGEINYPLSVQRGYVLVIPPHDGHMADAEYLLVGAHLDAAPSLFNPFGYHRPAINDNGFAAALLCAYASDAAKERGDRGLVIAGFPHEEGQGMYKLVAGISLAAMAGIGTSALLSPYLDQTLTFLLGYIATVQLYDVLGGPFKMGLAGSAAPFKKVLSKELGVDPSQVAHAINLDMVGTAGERTEVVIPYTSPTVNPMRWIFLKNMDRELIADIEAMLMLSYADKMPGEMTLNHHLLLGTSDNAELARYLPSVAGIFHVNQWDDLHTGNDTIDRIELANVVWYRDFLDRFVAQMGKQWKSQPQIALLEDRGLISTKNSSAAVYESGGRSFCLVRRNASPNPLNLLYEVERREGDSYSALRLITYGLQDRPLDLLRHPDSATPRLEYTPVRHDSLTFYDGREYQRFGFKGSFVPAQVSAEMASFAADRSLGLLTLGLMMVAGGAAAQVPQAGPVDRIFEQALEIAEVGEYQSYGVAREIVRRLPALAALGLGTGLGVKGIMKLAPFLKRQVRKLELYAGDNALPLRNL